jgi:hypothetical protein
MVEASEKIKQSYSEVRTQNKHLEAIWKKTWGDMGAKLLKMCWAIEVTLDALESDNRELNNEIDRFVNMIY